MKNCRSTPCVPVSTLPLSLPQSLPHSCSVTPTPAVSLSLPQSHSHSRSLTLSFSWCFSSPGICDSAVVLWCEDQISVSVSIISSAFLPSSGLSHLPFFHLFNSLSFSSQSLSFSLSLSLSLSLTHSLALPQSFSPLDFCLSHSTTIKVSFIFVLGIPPPLSKSASFPSLVSGLLVTCFTD